MKRNGDNFEANELWSNKDIVNQHGGVIRVGSNVYGHSDSKGWTCQDMLTGKVHWQEKIFGKGSIAYADNRFVLRTRLHALLPEWLPAYEEDHRRIDADVR